MVLQQSDGRITLVNVEMKVGFLKRQQGYHFQGVRVRKLEEQDLAQKK